MKLLSRWLVKAMAALVMLVPEHFEEMGCKLRPEAAHPMSKLVTEGSTGQSSKLTTTNGSVTEQQCQVHGLACFAGDRFEARGEQVEHHESRFECSINDKRVKK